MNTKEVSDFFAWLSALSGIIGSLILIRPLFLLLRQREAVDDMGYGIEYDLLSPELASRIKVARRGFANTFHEQRFAWKGWVVAGAIALAISLICVVLQGMSLYLSTHQSGTQSRCEPLVTRKDLTTTGGSTATSASKRQ